MAEHSMLGASSAHRWIVCTPSAVLESKEPSKDTPYSLEGTAAHEEAADFLLGKKTGKPKYEIELYLDYIKTELNELSGKGIQAELVVESRLEFSNWVPGGFGTGDAIILHDEGIEIIDLKYGQGVPVSAVGNRQLKLYALGAIQTYGGLYENIKTIKITIVQPRLDSITSQSFTLDELLRFGEEIKPIALKASKGEGDLIPGHHCQFCKMAGKCRARAESVKELKPYYSQPVSVLTNTDVANILPQLDQVERWIKDVKEYATNELLAGRSIQGYKLVEGRSLRKYSDNLKVAQKLKEEGYAEAIIFKKELIGVSEMEKLLGKKTFNELLAPFIEKPVGKATLVPESDKRPAINLDPNESAAIKAALADDED